MRRLLMGTVMLVFPSVALAQMVIPRSAPLPVQTSRVETTQPAPPRLTPPPLEPLFSRERTARGSSPERNMLSSNPTLENAQLAFAMHTLRMWNTFEAVRLHEAVRLMAEEAARAKLGRTAVKGMGGQMNLFAEILKDYGIYVERSPLPANYDLVNLEDRKRMLGVLQKLIENPPMSQRMKEQLGSLTGQ